MPIGSDVVASRAGTVSTCSTSVPTTSPAM
jgi:hypothetical protein